MEVVIYGTYDHAGSYYEAHYTFPSDLKVCCATIKYL